MKKTIKFALSLLIVLCMITGFAVPVLAEGEFSSPYFFVATNAAANNNSSFEVLYFYTGSPVVLQISAIGVETNETFQLAESVDYDIVKYIDYYTEESLGTVPPSARGSYAVIIRGRAGTRFAGIEDRIQYEIGSSMLPSSWAYETVTAAIGANLVPPMQTGFYDSATSRNDAAQILVMLLEAASGKSAGALMTENGVSVDDDAFYDINPTISAAYIVNALGIMNGVSDGRFDPDGKLTRAQIAAIICRTANALGVDTSVSPKNSFTDTKGHWVDSELDWPVEAGIINGIGDNKFDPDAALTREQTIVIIYRAYQYFTK